MRDRVLEFLPLILVAVVLVGYQLLRDGPSQTPAMLPLATPAPPSAPAATGATPRRVVVQAPTAAVGQSATCSDSQPRFVGGFALLRAAVGAPMGDALDCEHAVNSQGDTQQRTTTGLAYYLKTRNAPCFTTGYDHWALASDGSVVRWTGESPTPPE